jgi:hypothetical protein
MYTIRPIALDGEVYAAYGTEYFMDFRFPLTLRLRARECFDPTHLDTRWNRFCAEQLDDLVPDSDVTQLDDIILQSDVDGSSTWFP